MPIVEHAGGPAMLFTRRADHLRTHPGQITFPGGRADKTDTGPVATALRETEEEIGFASSSIEVVGFLDTFETFTGFLVTPVVGLVAPGFQLLWCYEAGPCGYVFYHQLMELGEECQVVA